MNATLAIAKNRNETVAVDLDGECLAYNHIGGSCVRKTTCGKFAVIFCKPNRSGDYRLVKTFANSDAARRYNAAIV